MVDNRIQDPQRVGFDGDSASGLVSDVLDHAAGLVAKEIERDVETLKECSRG